MLYFSELKGKHVVTENGIALGKLQDLVFLTQSQPFVTKLVVGSQSKPIIIPLSDLVRLNNTIHIANSFTTSSLEEGELYVNHNLLDQQIIDLKGNKVVRVNDVAIQEKPQLVIAGVDIGFLGILRWFGMEETFGRVLRIMGTTPQSRFLSWADIQPLALARGKVILKKEEKKLAQLLPEDLADHLENMSVRNITRVLDVMEEPLAAQVIESLNINSQLNLFKEFTPERSAKLIERMDPDDAVDILLTLTPHRREQILTFVSASKQETLTALFSLSKTPIGELITTEFFTARPEDTVLAIRRRIRAETAEYSSLSYVYAVNKNQQLVGVASLHELLVQQGDVALYKFMTPSVVVLHLTTPLEIAIKRMFKYKLEALPVVGTNRELLGIVTDDDLAETILQKL